MEPEEKGLSLSDYASKKLDLQEYTEIKKLFEPVSEEYIGKSITTSVLREMSEKIKEIGSGAEHLGDVFKKYGYSADDFSVEMEPHTGRVLISPKRLEVEKSGGEFKSEIDKYISSGSYSVMSSGSMYRESFTKLDSYKLDKNTGTDTRIDLGGRKAFFYVATYEIYFRNYLLSKDSVHAEIIICGKDFPLIGHSTAIFYVVDKPNNSITEL